MGINLLKIDLVSARHLKEMSEVLETSSQDIRISFNIRIPFKCRGDYMYFYTHTRLGKLRMMSSQRFPLLNYL